MFKFMEARWSGWLVDTLQQTLFIKRVESQLKDGSDLNDFKAIINEIVVDLGFSDFHLAPLKKYDGLDFTLSTMPEPLSEYYTEFDLHKHDILVECMFHDARPMFQKTVDDYVENAPYMTEQIDINKDIRKLLNEYQFYDCLVMPVPNDVSRETRDADVAKSKGFLAIYNKGESIEDFQKKASARKVEINLLAISSYRFGSRFFSQQY